MESKNQSDSGGSLNAPHIRHTHRYEIHQPQSGRGMRRNNLKAKGVSLCKHKKFWEL